MTLQFFTLILGLAASVALSQDYAPNTSITDAKNAKIPTTANDYVAVNNLHVVDGKLKQNKRKCFQNCLSDKVCVQSFPQSCTCANANKKKCSEDCDYVSSPETTPQLCTSPPDTSRKCYNNCLASKSCVLSQSKYCTCANNAKRACSRECNHQSTQEACAIIETPPKLGPKACFSTCLSEFKCIQKFPENCLCENIRKRNCSTKCQLEYSQQLCESEEKPKPIKDSKKCFEKCLSKKVCPQLFPQSCHCNSGNRMNCSAECQYPILVNTCEGPAPKPIPTPKQCFGDCLASRSCPDRSSPQGCLCSNGIKSECSRICNFPSDLEKCGNMPGCFEKCIASKKCSTLKYTSEYDKCMCDFNAATTCAPVCGVKIKLKLCEKKPEGY